MEETLTSIAVNYPGKRYKIVNIGLVAYRCYHSGGVERGNAILPHDLPGIGHAVDIVRPVIGDVDAVVKDTATRRALLDIGIQLYRLRAGIGVYGSYTSPDYASRRAIPINLSHFTPRLKEQIDIAS